MKNYSVYYNNKDDIQQLLKKLDPNKSTLVQVFCGIVNENIIKEIQAHFQPYKNITLIGTTTDGEINNKVSTKQIVIVATQFDNTTLKCHFSNNKNEFLLGKEIADNIIEPNTKAIISFMTGIGANGEDYLHGLSQKDIIIAGGLAGDNGELQKTFVFDKENITDFGAVGVSLNSDTLIVSRNYALNWIGITNTLTVTKSDKNRVYEINGKNPVEIYRKYLGDMVADRLPKTGIEFPLLIEKNGIKIARAIIGKENDCLIFAGNIDKGEKVKIGYGNVTDILEKDNSIFKELINNPIETVFIYSCMARRRFLGKNIDIEINPFSKIAPTFGFFTYGEFYNKNLLNETMTVLTLSEAQNINNKTPSIKNTYDDQLVTLNALTHLVKVTLNDINHLNENLASLVKEKTKKILQKNKELEYQYYHNLLTGLPNRYALEKEQNNYNIALLVDIVKFSVINELYGEDFGDKILLEVAKYLTDIATKNSVKLYKTGSDQFMFLMKEDKFIEKEINSIDLTINNIKIHIDFKTAKSKEKPFTHKTELALKYIKSTSKKFIEYSKELKLEEQIQNDIEIITEVANAIKEDRIIPFFQKIDKKDKISYECLVRLKTGNRYLTPFFFLDKIQNTPYYFDITKIMIEKSCKYFSDKPYDFSLNFSYKDIINPEILEFLFKKADEYNVKNKLIIEILESESIGDYKKVKAFIKKLKDNGIKVAIDDFGSGYSNFVILKELSPNFIKIDGSIIKVINEDEKTFEIAKTINDLAKKLNIKTVAEFVANKDIKGKLEELNIDGLQGFFIDVPKPDIES